MLNIVSAYSRKIAINKRAAYLVQLSENWMLSKKNSFPLLYMKLYPYINAIKLP